MKSIRQFSEITMRSAQKILIFLGFIFFNLTLFSQKPTDFNAHSTYFEFISKPQNFHGKSDFVPSGQGFQLAIPPSDDSSSALINLPFNFCFFGATRNQVYINNNGNISFSQPFATSTALAFPFPNFQTISPFWADVDTRTAGKVWVKINPTSLIVLWEDVGYFDQNSDKLNTFQVILTNGFDPLLPQGMNVGFFYRDMKWTTGDASAGVNGFGGVAANVGVNRGNNTDFIPFGRFSQNNANYNGPLNNSGIRWLENRHIFFNTCSSNNIQPAVSGKFLSDTIRICVGDTFNYEVTVHAPEDGQIVNTSAFSSMTGFSSSHSNVGSHTKLDLSIPATISNVGFHTITIAAVDNGSPARNTIFNMVVEVGTISPEPFITGDSSVCDGDTVLLTVNPNYDTYLWANGSDSNTTRVSHGTHRVTVSQSLCSQSVSYTVIRKNPIPTISGPKYMCLPDTITLKAVGGYDSYVWSTSANDTLDSVLVFGPGTYTVTAFLDGCEGVSSFELFHLGVDPYTMSASRLNSCNGDSVTLNAGADFDVYTWNTGDSTRIVKVDSGFYSVTVTLYSADSINICTDTSNRTIGYVSYPSLSLTFDSLFCFGTSTTITVDSIYPQYNWSTGSTNQSIAVNNSGTYKVTVTIVDCEEDTSVRVTRLPRLNPSISGRQYYCPTGDSVELSVGIGWDSVLWNTGDTSSKILVTTGTFVASVWRNGCMEMDSITVDTLRDGFSVLGSLTYCSSNTTRLNAGFGFDSYLWNTGDTTQVIDVTQGTYQVTVTLQSCTAVSDSVVVTEINAIAPEILGDTVLCGSNSTGILSVNPIYQSYLWSSGVMLPFSPINDTGWYSVTVTDASGCSLIDSVFVGSFTPMPYSISGDTMLCENESTVLRVSPTMFNRIQWSNGSLDTSIVVGGGAYTANVIDTNGCRISLGPIVVNEFSPDVTIIGDTLACLGLEETLYALSNTSGTYVWSTGAIGDSILVIQGRYSVTFTDIAGCTASDTFDVFPRPAPTAKIDVAPRLRVASDEEVLFTDVSVANTGTLVGRVWTIDSLFTSTRTSATFTFEQDGKYRVLLRVIESTGCEDTTSVIIEVFSELKANNVITPNGDGINDFLVFSNLHQFPGSKLHIFNRWGENIYLDDNYQNNWDGRFMAEGTYYYVLEVGISGEILKGFFTLYK